MRLLVKRKTRLKKYKRSTTVPKCPYAGNFHGPKKSVCQKVHVPKSPRRGHVHVPKFVSDEMSVPKCLWLEC